MRTTRLLPLLTLAVVWEAGAQTITETTSSVAPGARDGGRIAVRPGDPRPCAPWLQGCTDEDRNRMLLLLSVMGGGKRPLILR